MDNPIKYGENRRQVGITHPSLAALCPVDDAGENLGSGFSAIPTIPNPLSPGGPGLVSKGTGEPYRRGQAGQLIQGVDHLSGAIHSLCRAADPPSTAATTTGPRPQPRKSAIWGRYAGAQPLIHLSQAPTTTTNDLNLYIVMKTLSPCV